MKSSATEKHQPSVVFPKLIALLLFALTGCKEEPLSDQYPEPWSSEPLLEIARTLVKNKVAGCGEFWWRAHQGESGPGTEYLVYCTRDGATWRGWLLWPLIDKVHGPFTPIEGIPLPR